MYSAAFGRYLTLRGLVVFDQAGADCFLEQLPAEPVDAVGLYAKADEIDDLSDHSQVGLQIIVRADGTAGRAREGYERALRIRWELHGLRHLTLDPGGPDETRVVWCRALQHPLNLGDDQASKPRWSINYELLIHVPSALAIP